MRGSIAVALTALGVAVAGSSAANAESAMKLCGDQWQVAKAAGTTNGQTWPQFLAQCRAQLTAGVVAPSSASAPAPIVARSGGAGEFASEQQVRARCPSDTVVWVNTLSHVYHFPGASYHAHSYPGHTKEGAYMCEADAKAPDERHP